MKMLKKLLMKFEKRKMDEIYKQVGIARTMAVECKRVNYGEEIDINKIKILPDWKRPRSELLYPKREYKQRYGYHKSTVVLDDNNILLDGYTTYLLEKEAGSKTIVIKRAN